MHLWDFMRCSLWLYWNTPVLVDVKIKKPYIARVLRKTLNIDVTGEISTKTFSAVLVSTAITFCGFLEKMHLSNDLRTFKTLTFDSRTHFRRGDTMCSTNKCGTNSTARRKKLPSLSIACAFLVSGVSISAT